MYIFILLTPIRKKSSFNNYIVEKMLRFLINNDYKIKQIIASHILIKYLI